MKEEFCHDPLGRKKNNSSLNTTVRDALFNDAAIEPRTLLIMEQVKFYLKQKVFLWYLWPIG